MPSDKFQISKLIQNPLWFYTTAFSWLPVGILLYSIIRFFALPTELFAWIYLLPATIGGVPLALALRAIYRKSYFKTAGISLVVLAPLTILGGVLGGLFGPVGLVLYPAFFSLPAWIAYGIVCLWEKLKQRNTLSP